MLKHIAQRLYSGRLSRSCFIIMQIAIFSALSASPRIAARVLPYDNNTSSLSNAILIFVVPSIYIAAFVLESVIITRRLHDVGRTMSEFIPLGPHNARELLFLTYCQRGIAK